MRSTPLCCQVEGSSIGLSLVFSRLGGQGGGGGGGGGAYTALTG